MATKKKGQEEREKERKLKKKGACIILIKCW